MDEYALLTYTAHRHMDAGATRVFALALGFIAEQKERRPAPVERRWTSLLILQPRAWSFKDEHSRRLTFSQIAIPIPADSPHTVTCRVLVSRPSASALIRIRRRMQLQL
jgi:hypothetical protein